MISSTLGALTRARMSAYRAKPTPKKRRHPRTRRLSELFHPKKDQPPAPVTLTYPRCNHTITLEVAGTAYCRPCRQPMRPRGGKRQKRARHAPNPHEPRPKEGSNRPIMNTAGGRTWHAHP